MSKASLRALQMRLITRLEAAQHVGASVSWLAVKTGTFNALIPLAQAGEIFESPNITPVPYAAPWFVGVVNSRGILYGVVDLAGFVQPDAQQRSADKPRLVSFNADLEINCALRVDALCGLRGLDAFVDTQAPPATAPAYFGVRVKDAVGVVWQEIDLYKLSVFPPFLNIGT